MANTTTIRPAEAEDIPSIAAIHSYYVLNTVATFTEEPVPQERFLTSYHSIVSSGLPYLVAIDGFSSSLIGYVYAHDFRHEGAYRPTVEISLYCHPDHRGTGAGTMLLEKLILALRDPVSHPELFHHDSQGKTRVIKEVLSVMAVDTTGRGNGLELKKFYEKFGFVLRGHLHRVGYKFDRWIDTMYLQLSL